MTFFEEKHADKYLELDQESEVDRKLTILETQHILREIEIEGPILDVGFGHGVVTSELLSTFGTSSVVEGSSRLCEIARDSHPFGLTVHHSLFEEFVPKSRYRTVFATGILHHLQDPQRTLARLVDWVEPSGKVIISVPNGHSIHRALGYSLGIQDAIDSMTETGKKSGVAQVLNPKVLREMIEIAGLDVVKEHDSYVKILSNQQMASLRDDQLSDLFQLSRIVPREFHATLIFECQPVSRHNIP